MQMVHWYNGTMIYAVIDTNVFVAALLSRHSNSATVLVVDTLLNFSMLAI